MTSRFNSTPIPSRTVTKEAVRMTLPRRLFTRLLLLIALASTACLLIAGSASAASPWWHLASGSRPSDLAPGPAQNEVYEVAIAATEGNFYFQDPVSGQSDILPPLPYNATHQQVQLALEGIYGAGNVEVPKGQGDEAGSEPYEIIFTAAKAAQPVRLLAKSFPGSFAGFTPLAGGTHGSEEEAVALSEKSAGRPDGQIIVTAANLGDAPVDGETEPVVVEDILPPGLKATSVTALAGGSGALNRGPVTCSPSPVVRCTFAGSLPAFAAIEVRIGVVVGQSAASGEPNEVLVSGGEASPDSLVRPIAVSEPGKPTPFGIEGYELSSEEEGGAPATQAGSHPFQQTTVITLNQSNATEEQQRYGVTTPELPQDVSFRWPPGLIGNPTPFARCTMLQFATQIQANALIANACPGQAAVGVALVDVVDPGTAGYLQVPAPIFNLEPGTGEPARFGFLASGVPVLIEPAVRDGVGGDYGITVSTPNIPQNVNLLSAQATIWGVPGDGRHDGSRGWACIFRSLGHEEASLPCESPAEPHPPAFLTLPTSCPGSPLQTSAEAASWAPPHLFSAPFPADPAMVTLDGCNRLPFSPQIESEPTSNAATSPTGLSFDLSVKDEGLLNADGLAQSLIKKAVVTLPEGFTTNPSVAEGLKSCPQTAYEEASVQPGSGCPSESKIGDVEIESPLVKQKVLGSLYVARQGENPNPTPQNPKGNLLTIYLVARNPEIGVVVKQALKVTPNPVTGQLVTEVDNIPQLPFSRFHLSFRQGQRSPLITPPACGTYTVKADLYPYSNPTAPLTRESSFQITQGPEGNPCPNGAPPFHPNLLAGSENPTAGAYSPFYTDISRKDSEQEITHFSIKLPPGVIGKLAGVGSCSDAQIAAAKAREHEGGGGAEQASPSCPAASQIGRSNVGSGVGNVLAYAPGKLYLAGPYHGSNLSIVSITAAKVGPFDLGTVVVRFALRIDPETAQVFVDSQGSDPIPHIVDGIPVHLRDVQATVNRPEFTLNPTSCAKKSTASTVLGSGLNFASEADDQPVTVTSPFQVGNCASLGFKPDLALSLKGGTHRGATPAFKAVVTFPKGAYANTARAAVTLPHSEFLEQAHIGTVCTRAQFKEGKVPGEKCPAASIYGKAEAITPLLSEPLKGPVYLRSSSHNLPDLVAALHNNQVDFALDGRIDSVENGRIRNTFETVPDAPVSKFVLEMQGGKKGLLVNSTNICAKKNRAISDLTGQNGKLFNTNPVLRAPCGAKAKKKGKAHKRSHAKKGVRHS